MIRTGLLTIVMIVALQGFCFGQGLLDSVLGPGGLGLWGGDTTSQYQNPQMWTGNAQGQMQQPAPGQQPTGYPQQGYAYPQAQAYGYQQQGVNSDWQNYPSAPVGSGGQQYSPPQQPAAPPQYGVQQQYQTQQQFPPQQRVPAQQQYSGSQRYNAPRAQAVPVRPTQAATARPSFKPGEYAPGQAPVTAEDLPAGAVRMTTTTPQGTRVDYYPPAGEPNPAQGAVRRPVRHLKPKPAGAKAQSARRFQPREQTAGRAVSQASSSIAMPKPVAIPQGQDPRFGWSSAVNRGPTAQPAR
ncbi:MAG: hypothetical protein WBG50_23610 [Desulfomonilaceae bacterium]